MTVIDYTSSWGGFAGAADVKAHGFDGIMRYLSYTPKKNLTDVERDEARVNGLTIGLVWETVANRAGQGHQAGVDDAHAANAQADALGYPKNCTLWYAVDFDGDPAAVQPYFDGVASVGGRTHAPYGGFRIIEGVTYPAHGWQTVAWSRGHTSNRAGLRQSGFHGNYDTNDVLMADYGQWNPTTQENDMTPDESNKLTDIWNMTTNLQNVSSTFIEPVLKQIKADVENPATGGGAGQISAADIDRIAKAELDAMAARLQS